MSDLSSRECVPCRGGVPPLTEAQIDALMPQLDPQWRVEREQAEDVPVLRREYRFKNFAQALEAAVRIGELAEEQQHHPDLHVAWGKLGVEVWTHKIHGLSENDFIFAAKCDAILREGVQPRSASAAT